MADLVKDKLGEDELRNGLLNDEEEVFKYLFNRVIDVLVHKYLSGRPGAQKDAEDYAEIAITEVWRKLKAEKPFQGSIMASVHAIARNKCIDGIRKASRATHVPLDDRLPDEKRLDEVMLKERRFEVMEKHLQQLKGNCKELLELKHYHTLSIKEIALKMGLKGNYIKKRLSNCRDKLRTLVKNDAEYLKLIEV